VFLEQLANNKLMQLNDEQQQVVNMFLKNDEYIHTTFEEEGRVYAYPYLHEVLKKNYQFFDITDEVSITPFVEKIEETPNSIIISGFVYSKSLSFIDKNLSYAISSRNKNIPVSVKINERSDLNRLSNGIMFYQYAGFTITISQKECQNVGDYYLTINKNELIKDTYFFTKTVNNLKVDYKKCNCSNIEFFKAIIVTIQQNRIAFTLTLTTECYENLPKLTMKIYKHNQRKSTCITELTNCEQFLFPIMRARRTVYMPYLDIEGKLFPVTIATGIKNFSKDNWSIDKSGKLLYTTNYVLPSKQQISLSLKIIKKFLRPHRAIIYRIFAKLRGDKKIITKLSTTPEDFMAIFSEFETKLDLLNYKVKSVQVWEISRFLQHNDIVSALGILDNIFLGKELQEKAAERKHIDVVLQDKLFEKSPFSIIAANIDEFVIDNNRKIKCNDEYIDILTYPYLESLNKQGKIVAVGEYNQLFEHKLATNNMRKYLDSYYRFAHTMKNFQLEFTTEDVTYMHNVEQAYRNTFGMKKQIDLLFSSWIKRYIYEYTYNYHVLRHTKVKKVTVSGPYRMWIYAVAKMLKIKSCELQYAAITQAHPAYNYVLSAHHRPEQLILWDEYWKKYVDTMGKKIDYMPIPTLGKELMIKQDKTYDIEYDYLYISQSTIGNKLIKFLCWHISKYPEDIILYRLHPHETVEQYPRLQKLIAQNKVVVVSWNEESIYVSLQRAKGVIGVYSTGLIEATNFEKKVYVVKNIPLANYYEKEFAFLGIKTINNPMELF